MPVHSYSDIRLRQHMISSADCENYVLPHASEAELQCVMNIFWGVEIRQRRLARRLHRVLWSSNVDDSADFIDAVVRVCRDLSRIQNSPI